MFVLLIIVFICGNTISADGSVISRRSGNSVVLQCEGDTTKTLISVTWKIHLLNNYNCLLSVIISNISRTYNNCTVRIKYDNLSLTIDSAQISDEGNYTCETATAHGTFINLTKLKVLAQPSVTLELNSEGSPECRAIGGYPAAEISWVPHSGDIKTTSAEQPDQTWTVTSLYNVRRVNVTSVTCVVSHPTSVDPQEKSISLTDPYSKTPILWIYVVIPILLFIPGCIFCWKLSHLRTCFKMSDKTTPPQVHDNIEEDMQEYEPYATYTQNENLIYCEISKENYNN